LDYTHIEGWKEREREEDNYNLEGRSEAIRTVNKSRQRSEGYEEQKGRDKD
jgi:hypothetical protein